MILKDKTILIMGIRNKWSIAYGVAEAAYKQGAKLIFTYMGEENKDKIEKLTEDFKESKAYVLDGASEDELVRDVFTKIKEVHHWHNYEKLHYNNLFGIFCNIFIFTGNTVWKAGQHIHWRNHRGDVSQGVFKQR